MTVASSFPLASLLVLFNVVFRCQTQSWELRRADPGSKTVSFYNNTVTDEYMQARWTWWDSSGGFWDTRLRVNKEELIGGGFSYFDQHRNELSSVRWFRMKMNRPIRWKYTSFASPPDSWWMRSVIPWGNITWGFKNQIDGSWVFKVDNDTLEPKFDRSDDGWSRDMGNRWKRSLKQRENDAEKFWKTPGGKTNTNSEDDDNDDDDDDNIGGENLLQMIIDDLNSIPVNRVQLR